MKDGANMATATAITMDRAVVVRRPKPAALSSSAVQMIIHDAALAASLANLTLLGAWRKILYLPPALAPLWSWRDVVAIVLNTALLFIPYWCLVRGFRKLEDRFAVLRLALFILPLYGIVNVGRQSNATVAGLFTRPSDVTLLAIILSLAAVIAIAHWDRRVVQTLERIAFISVILLPIFLVQAAFAIARQPDEPRLAGFLPATPAHRVVWIIFDEFDGNTVLRRRPAGLELPNVDSLAATSTNALNTQEAGTDTDVAMTSLISGKHVFGVGTWSANKLYLKLKPGTEYDNPFASDSLFKDVRAMGINAGVVGWYLPYCRVFAPALADCYMESMETRVSGEQPHLSTSIRGQLRTLSPFESRQRHILRYNGILQHAESMASDSRLGLVLLHLPVPHAPGIYDAKTGKLTPFRFGGKWYYDNIVLADRTLGAIRSAMEKAGVWNDTTVLVSSDHAARQYVMPGAHSTWVPFLLKMPGQTQSLQVGRPIDVLITRELIEQILSGKILNADDAGRWLANSKPVPAPPAD